jgi:hypothetical protein
MSRVTVSLVLVLVAAGMTSASAQRRTVDINSASVEELQRLPGVDAETARKIVAGRPHFGTADLMRKGIVSQATFDQIGGYLVAGGDATPPTPKPIRTTRDLADLAAKSHPGEKWGYVKVYLDSGDSVGETLHVKIPDSARDGALLTLPVSSGRLSPSKDLWTQVRGYVRRGRGEQRTDIFEVTGAFHRANPNLAKAGLKEYAVEGWRALRESIALTH